MQPDLFQYQNHFEFLGLIGATKLSEVFKVRHRQTNEIFAVKRSRKHFRSKLQRERCLREIRAVAQLPAHQNIVAQYRAWQEGGHFYIQMDYCEGGSLHHRIHAPNAQPLSDEEVWNVAVQVSRGLEFLHSHSILHLDIKPENLYCNLKADESRGPWKIGDFGLAVAKESKDWEEGDGDYVAPELLNSGCEPSYAADIFSLGATLYECATKKKLPRREGSPHAAEFTLEGRSDALHALLSAMLLPNAQERPFASQVVAYTTAALQQDDHNKQEGEEEGQDRDEGDEKVDSFAFNHQPGASPPTPLLIAAHQHDDTTTSIAANNNNNNTDTTQQQQQSLQQSRGLTITIPTSATRLPKWAPSLSPLASEGALTPGAAAGLMKLTPQAGDGASPVDTNQKFPCCNDFMIDKQEVEEEENCADNNTNNNDAVVNQRMAILPPLRLPPHQYNPHHPPSTSRTAENNSFRIRRRDLVSPGSEFPGSNSEIDSEAYSFSCDTPGSASDMEFPDVVSPQSARVLQQHPARVKSFHLSWEALTTDSPDKAAMRKSTVSHPLLPPLPPHTDGGGGTNSGRNRGELSSRSINGGGIVPHEDGAMPPPQLPHQGNTQLAGAAGPKYIPSPFQSEAVPPLNTAIAFNKGKKIAALIPPLSLPPSAPSSKAARRKRNLSSRRAYAQALKDSNNNAQGGGMDNLASSRSVDLCSSRSLEQFMPQKKGARVNGSFHMADSVDPTFNGGDDHEGQGPASGPSTQRSSRGQRSARLEDIMAAATGGGYHHAKDDKVHHQRQDAAAAAAVHMTNMTLRDVA